jgi:hypothetical protein
MQGWTAGSLPVSFVTVEGRRENTVQGHDLIRERERELWGKDEGLGRLLKVVE